MMQATSSSGYSAALGTMGMVYRSKERLLPAARNIVAKRLDQILQGSEHDIAVSSEVVLTGATKAWCSDIGYCGTRRKVRCVSQALTT